MSLKKTGGLGRGLEALLPGSVVHGGDAKGNDLFIPLEKIRPNPHQPRKFFDETALSELAASIKEHGIIEPLIVDKADDGIYEIIAGERRFRAAVMAGLREVPAVVRDFSEEKRMEISLIENIQRENLNPIEEAEAYREIMKISGLSQDEVAEKVGKSRPAVANVLRLLKLPETIKTALKQGEITQGHARAILSVEGEAAKLSFFKEVKEKALSVRETEARANEFGAAKSGGAGATEKPAAAAPSMPASARDPNVISMENRFIEKFGTKVKIDGNIDKGVIKIEYYTTEDLDRIYEILSD